MTHTLYVKNADGEESVFGDELETEAAIAQFNAVYDHFLGQGFECHFKSAFHREVLTWRERGPLKIETEVYGEFRLEPQPSSRQFNWKDS